MAYFIINVRDYVHCARSDNIIPISAFYEVGFYGTLENRKWRKSAVFENISFKLLHGEIPIYIPISGAGICLIIKIMKYACFFFKVRNNMRFDILKTRRKISIWKNYYLFFLHA